MPPGGAAGRELARLDPLQDRVWRHRAELGNLAGREMAGWLGGGQWVGERAGTENLMDFIGSGHIIRGLISNVNTKSLIRVWGL